MKNKDWERGRGGGGLNREGGPINFPPLKRGWGLIREGGLIEDLRYILLKKAHPCLSC